MKIFDVIVKDEEDTSGDAWQRGGESALSRVGASASQWVKMAGAGGPHSANSPCNLSRSLDRILVDAQATCELKLSGRKLKEYPKGASKYNLSDTVLAGKLSRV